jgi:hypothetical protein
MEFKLLHKLSKSQISVLLLKQARLVQGFYPQNYVVTILLKELRTCRETVETPYLQ